MFLVEKTIEEKGFNPHIKKGNTLKYCMMKCDLCGVEYEIPLYRALRGRKHLEIDSCGKKKCAKEKTKKVNLHRYGVESTNQLKSTKEKKKKVCIEKYGVDNPAKVKMVREKIKKTNIKKYGAEHAMSNKEVCNKAVATTKERHGEGFYQNMQRKGAEQIRNNQQEVVQKRKDTCLERYGVDNPTKVQEFKEKIKKTNIKKYGVESHFQSDSFIKEMAKNRRVSFCEIQKLCEKKNYKPMFTHKEYENNRTVLYFKCLAHDFIFESNTFYVKGPFNQCPKCYNYSSSRQEEEISKFLTENNISHERGNRKVLNRKELDFYMPDLNLAIEFHGLYWHCEINKDKDYHYNKFIQCKEADIRLLQVFEDEWRDKQEVWKSIILAKCNKISNKLDARKLIVDENFPKKKVIGFVEENHLQGNCRSKKAFVLKDDLGNIKFCITMRKPFTKNREDTIEVARVCTEKGTIVRGAFSRLIKYIKEWAKNEGYSKILTYSDCRYSQGSVYAVNNFNYISHTGIGYDYTDYIYRYGRFKFRAQPGKSELDVASESGVCKIYNSGNYSWQLILN